MSARWWTLGVWALAAASALFWGLKLFVKAPAAPAQAQLAQPGAGLRGDLTRLLGTDPPPPVVAQAAAPAPDARFALIGVVSPRSPQAAREGLALIAVDGKPPRAYRVGAIVDGANVLKTVSARGATLGPVDGGALISLQVAAVPAASTGSLPTLGTAAPAAQPQRPVRPAALPATQVPAEPTPIIPPPGFAPPPRGTPSPAAAPAVPVRPGRVNAEAVE